jgi:hypothetical protein
MFVFVAGNVAVFQPWAWDDTKVLMYWFLATSILAAALVARLRSGPGALARVALCGLDFGLVASGPARESRSAARPGPKPAALDGRVAVGEYVRRTTPPRSVFAAAPQHNQPVSLLAGRT